MWFWLIAALFLCLLHISFNYNRRARLIRRIPGPKDIFIVGNALDNMTSPVRLFHLMREYSKQWKRINRFWSFPIAAINIYQPDDIEIVIATTKHNAKSPIYSFLNSWLRDGLLLSQGSKWQTRRKILTPAFHFNILRRFWVILEDNSRRFVDNIRDIVGEPVDVIPTLSEYTLHSICETAMGSRLSDESIEVGRSYKEAVYALGNQFAYRLSRIYLHWDFINNLWNFGKPKKDLNTVHKFSSRVIKSRKEYVERHGVNAFNDDDEHVDTFVYNKKVAMLDLLIVAQRNGLIDDLGVQEEVDTFMFEGHDTTACGLTYTLMLIANHKPVQDRIAVELNEIFGDSTRQANIEEYFLVT